MIISHKHKYLFIELPRTGTTAIAHELLETYEGEEILSKHATYRDFVKKYPEKASEYFVFSCRRNPIDRVYSYYVKMKSGYYDFLFNRKRKNLYERLSLLPTVKWIKKNDPNFNEFLKKRYKFPYCDWSVLDHASFDFVIDFKSLNEGFEEALIRCGIEPKRELPQKNVTIERNNLSSVLKETNQREINRVFGPFFVENELDCEGLIQKDKIKKSDFLTYKFVKAYSSVYWNYIK